jgi:hypothetical protein
MNDTHEPESPVIAMLYKLTQDVYVQTLGNGAPKLSKRDVDKIRTCCKTLKTIIKELHGQNNALPSS